jgi:hypothetical protein
LLLIRDYTRRKSTAKKADNPMQIRRTAIAISGDRFPSFVTPAIAMYEPLQR